MRSSSHFGFSDVYVYAYTVYVVCENDTKTLPVNVN